MKRQQFICRCIYIPLAIVVLYLYCCTSAYAQSVTKSANVAKCSYPVSMYDGCTPSPSRLAEDPDLTMVQSFSGANAANDNYSCQIQFYCEESVQSNGQTLQYAGLTLGPETYCGDAFPESGQCLYTPPNCPEPQIGTPPDCECPEGMMEPAQGFGKNSLLCTDIVEDPTDCADDPVFDTAVSVEGNYMCGAAADECPSGFDPGTAYNADTDTSVNTCDDGWTDDSSSSSSDSSSSSGNNSSDGGDDDNDGDGDSSDGDDANNSSSSGSSSSSGNQGECDPETETCENTASGGEDCGEPPQCQGDGIQCAQLLQQWYERCPNTGLEEFDGIEHELDMEQRVQEAIDEYEQRFNEIKTDFQDTIGAHLGGGQAGIPSNKHTVHGQEIEIGIASRKDFFDLIRNLIYFGCLLYAFYILMRA